MSVAKEDIPETVFTCYAGHYGFKKVPFGLKQLQISSKKR